MSHDQNFKNLILDYLRERRLEYSWAGSRELILAPAKGRSGSFYDNWSASLAVCPMY